MEHTFIKDSRGGGGREVEMREWKRSEKEQDVGPDGAALSARNYIHTRHLHYPEET